MSSWQIDCDDDHVSLHLLGLGRVNLALQPGGPVILWSRYGEVRRIPKGVLQDALDWWMSWRGKPARWDSNAPRGLGLIFWDQVITDSQPPPAQSPQ